MQRKEPFEFGTRNHGAGQELPSERLKPPAEIGCGRWES